MLFLFKNILKKYFYPLIFLYEDIKVIWKKIKIKIIFYRKNKYYLHQINQIVLQISGQ